MIAVVLKTTIECSSHALWGERQKVAELFAEAQSLTAMLEAAEHCTAFAYPIYLFLVGNRPVVGLTVAAALTGAGLARRSHRIPEEYAI